MAVYVHKHWNMEPSVLPEGVAVQVTKGGNYLHVVNREGAMIARFEARVVKKYWIQSQPITQANEH